MSSQSWPLPRIPKLKRVILFFATGAGTGYFPWLPGTVGTLLAIPLSFALNRMAAASLPLSLLTLGAFVAAALWFCERATEIFREKDSPKIVIDEMAGFLAANFLSPGGLKPTAAAFLLFRVFDIMKLFPANRAEQIQGGAGVILDDLIAGFYTFVILRLLLFWGLL